MPIKVQDDQGNEVEALTQEEAEAKAKEAADAARKEAETSFTEKSQANQAELERLQAEEKNWKELRDKAAAGSEAEKQAKEALEEAKKAREMAEGVTTTRIEETKTDAIAKLAGSDKDLREKIAHHFQHSTTGPTATKEEIEARVRNAYLIATGGQAPGALQGAAVSSAGAGTTPSGAGITLTPEEKDLSNKLGLSDKDLKDFGGKPLSPAN